MKMTTMQESKSNRIIKKKKRIRHRRRPMLLLQPRLLLMLFVTVGAQDTTSYAGGTIRDHLHGRSNSYTYRGGHPLAYTQDFSHSLDPYTSRYGYGPDFYPEYAEHFRYSRSVNDKADFLNHTTIVAHIANGIALQAGLMDEKIPIDEAVGELLNFGSVKVSDIAGFKPDKITALTTKLKGIQKDLDSTAVPFEQQALKWNELRIKSESVGDVKTLPGSTEYFADVTTLITSKDTSSLGDPQAKILLIEKTLREIEQIDSNSMSEMEAFGKFGTLKQRFEATIDSINKFKETGTKLDSYDHLKNGPTILEPLESMINLIETRDGFKLANTDESNAKIKENLEKVLGLQTASIASRQDILNIDELTKSRAHPELKTMKFTNGFPNGLSDVKQLVKDVRDPWIGKITGFEGSQMNGLADGLQPLFKVKDQLNAVNEKLNPISSSEIHRSLSNFEQLQNGISVLKPESVELSVTVLKNFDACRFKDTKPILSNSYANSLKIIENAKYLKTMISSAKSAAADFNVDDLKGKMDSFLISLELDFVKPDFSKAFPLAKKLKDEDGLKEIKKNINQVKQRFAGINITGIDTQLTTIESGNGKINTFQGLDDEIAFHTCIQGLKEDSEKVSEAIMAAQKLRALDQKLIGDVETVASAVSEASKGLSGIKTIPETMKKEVSSQTEEINKMPDAIKNSVIIGQSVNSLRSAYGLKELTSSINQIENVGSIVEASIHKIASPGVRKSIESQWGNHKNDMAELNGALKDVIGFESKLDVSNAKTLSQFGTPLKDLATFKDVKIDAKKKSKALESLIQLDTTDANDKKELETSKATLDTLATLDLQFSSHTTQFQQAPTAFKALHDFLTQFLKIEHHQSNQLIEENGWAVTILIVFGSLAGLALIAVPIGCVLWKMTEPARQRKALKKRIPQLQEWIKKQYNPHPTIMVELIESLMKVVGGFTNYDCRKSNEALGRDNHRYPNAVPCNPKTMIKFKVKGRTYKVHANWVPTRFPNRKNRFIATQGPIPKTLEDFWMMIVYYQCEFIVMLCDLEEGGRTKCDAYFDMSENSEPMMCGRFKITVKESESILNGNGKRRTLEIVDTLNQLPTRVVTHYHYRQWPDKSVPAGHEDVVELMKLVNKSEKPVVVHCSAGIGRTISFIGIEFLAGEVKQDPNVLLDTAMVKLREHRWMGVQTMEQMYWFLLAVVYMFCEEYKFDKEDYNKQFAMFNRIRPDLRRKQVEFEKTNREMQRFALAERNQGGQEEAETSSSESSVDSEVSAESDNYDSDLEEVDRVDQQQGGQEEANAENERPNQVIIPINDEANAGQEQGEGGQEAANDRERPPFVIPIDED